MTVRLLLAALAGGAVMALEALSSRWLAPAFGFTLSTWAVLIAVTLLAGSIGAALGGLLSRDVRPALVGLALAVAGAWTAAAAFLAPTVADGLIGLDLLPGSVVAALVLLFVPVVALASVLPQLVVGSGARTTGSAVGWLMAASTFGSLVGTLATALVLVPAVGMQWTAVAWATALVLSGAMLPPRGYRGVPSILIVLAAIVGVVALTGASTTLDRDTPYGRLTVRTQGDGYVIAVNGIAQASASPLVSGPGALISSRHYVELLPWIRPRGQSALVVGLGGGLVPTALAAYGIETVSFEINPGIADLVCDDLGFGGEVRVGDGRALWRRTDERFDFVVLDAFQGEGLPAHLLTREAFAELSHRLEPRGVVCVHLIGLPAHRVTDAVWTTLGSVFEHRLGVRAGLGDEVQDLFLFASDGPLAVPAASALVEAGWLGNEEFEPSGHGRVLTDDDTPLDLWNEPLARALRRRAMR